MPSDMPKQIANRRLFYRVVPTHYRSTKFVTYTSDVPTGTADEFISTVKVYVTRSWNMFEPPEGSDRWVLLASFQRYSIGQEWFIGHAGWHAHVPVTHTLFRPNVDRTHLPDCLDALKLAANLTQIQKEETGEYKLYGRAVERVKAFFTTSGADVY